MPPMPAVDKYGRHTTPLSQKYKVAYLFNPYSDYLHHTINSWSMRKMVLYCIVFCSLTYQWFYFDSIFSLPVDERIKIAHTPSGSRVFDALLDSTTVPAKTKRQLVIDFIGHYHLLIDDKLGSRVGDRCWAFVDTYLKVCPPPPISLKWTYY